MKSQRSKKARKNKKEALFAGFPSFVGHPSHVSGKRSIDSFYRREFMSLHESELREGKIYYRCKKCGKLYASKFNFCQYCLSELEQIKVKDAKIEVINK